MNRFGLYGGSIARTFTTTEAFINDLEAKWRLLHQNVFKRYQAPPVVKVSTRAFGFDYHESQVQPSFTRRYEVLKQQARTKARRCWPVETIGRDGDPEPGPEIHLTRPLRAPS